MTLFSFYHGNWREATLAAHRAKQRATTATKVCQLVSLVTVCILASRENAEAFKK